MSLKSLGKIFITPEGEWNKNKEYQVLSMVYQKNDDVCDVYISNDVIPVNTLLGDERWTKMLEVNDGKVNINDSEINLNTTWSSTKIKTLMDSIDKLNDEFNVKITFIESKIESLENIIEALNEKVTTLEQQLSPTE